MKQMTLAGVAGFDLHARATRKAVFLARMVVGQTVIDHERVARGPDGPVFDVAAIYTFRDEKIARIDFIR